MRNEGRFVAALPCGRPLRTTLALEDDELVAAQELARQRGTTAGQVVSRVLRAVLTGGIPLSQAGAALVAGLRPLVGPDQKRVTDAQMERLRDREASGCLRCWMW